MRFSHRDAILLLLGATFDGRYDLGRPGVCDLSHRAAFNCDSHFALPRVCASEGHSRKGSKNTPTCYRERCSTVRKEQIGGPYLTNPVEINDVAQYVVIILGQYRQIHGFTSSEPKQKIEFLLRSGFRFSDLFYAKQGRIIPPFRNKITGRVEDDVLRSATDALPKKIRRLRNDNIALQE